MNGLYGRSRLAWLSALLPSLFLLTFVAPALAQSTLSEDAPLRDPRIWAGSHRGDVPDALFAPWGEREAGALGVLGSGDDPGGRAHWTFVAPGPVRHTYASAFDAAGRRLFLLEGSDGPDYQFDVWVLDLATDTWTHPAVPEGPEARRLSEAVFDPVRSRVIVFGGFDGTLKDDLWSFDPASLSWQALPTSGPAPSARGGHAMVYDETNDRVVLFGGYDGVTQPSLRLNDVWALDLGGTPLAWEQLLPSGTPPVARSSHAAVYDDAGPRMLVVGGTSPAFLNDVWALSLSGAPAWTQITVPGLKPSPREEHAMAWHPVRNVLQLHGGYDTPFAALGDLWELSLDQPSHWSRVRTRDMAPPNRWGHAAVLDAEANRVVLHGGRGAYTLADTWSFHVDPPGRGVREEAPPVDYGATAAAGEGERPVALSVSNASFRAGRVELTLASGGGGPVRVDLLDVTGRRLATRSVPVAGADTRIAIETPGARPGLYFLRASDRHTTLVTRVVRMP